LRVARVVHHAILISAVLLSGCRESAAPGGQLILATTTSVEDSGLLDALLPAFHAAHPSHSVKVLAVGSGQAFELGRRKDADVLITHAPYEEAQFVHSGLGRERVELMYNHFDIVGPAADPAAVRSSASAPEAFQRIAQARAPFVSRGDSSGTHLRELAMWEASGMAPAGADWYVQAGAGMADVLRIAAERQAYILVDRATYRMAGDAERLAVLFDGTRDDQLFNPYAVIIVIGSRNAEGAKAFAEWLKGNEAQGIIARYGVDRFGSPLFTPSGRP
jgi:tungstate transport system substrate-binding protein